jgi:hypothetical protein
MRWLRTANFNRPMPANNLLLKTKAQDDLSLRADAGLSRGDSSSGSGKPHRTKRILLAGILLFAFVYLFHPLALRWLAEPLTAGDARPVDADLICMAVGEDGLAEVITACRKRPACRVLLIPWRSNRLIELGMVTPGELRFRRILEDAGVAGSQIEISQPPIATDWELVERLSGRLAADSTASGVILCDQFSGRRWRRIIGDTVPDEMARRIRVRSVEDSVVHVHDWWRSKAGIKEIFRAYLGLIFASLHGRESAPADESSAEAYEALSRLRSIPEL